MPKIRISYRDKNGKPVQDDLVTIGAFAQIGAKRKFGLDVLKSEDPEAGLFACFIELNGPQAAKADDDDAFDEWLMTVVNMSIEKDADPADPPSAGTPSSDSSPESPPTSD